MTNDPGNPKHKNGEHPMGDAGQMIGLGVFAVVWVADSFFLKKTTLLAEFIPLYQRLFVSIICAGAAIFLIKSGHVVVEGERRPDHVVSTGAFRYIRHPLYLGSLLLYFSFSFVTGSVLCLALTVILAVFYNYLATYEETLMVAKLGHEYADYREKTGKWIPGIGRSRREAGR
jgi:protein-S-isoprenylcysteine O-methyltransferase Ste14